jgi:hypothetical protein
MSCSHETTSHPAAVAGVLPGHQRSSSGSALHCDATIERQRGAGVLGQPTGGPAVKQKQATQETDRNARIIKRAIEIMAEGHYGWSWALAKARAEVK